MSRTADKKTNKQTKRLNNPEERISNKYNNSGTKHQKSVQTVQKVEGLYSV